MAKLKTFADGDGLPAADINTYLNPDVPSGATVYDTGWVTTGVIAQSAVTSAPGTVAYRRVGMTVYVYIDNFVATITSVGVNGNCTNTALFQMPTGFRPSRQQGGLGSTSTGPMLSAIIGTTGIISVTALAPDATQTATVASQSITLGLGGSYLLG